ncbi:hypothetical protein [Diaphorobacter sp. HDW4A]|uniref:hypothetical protein n=1 Tax=Diaphorobacter sp. HDW4A TaxID=2714924 RepID=UPI00198021FE|nr:hypothetical protein [Diaphorobacter sp. HDW4A]
MIDDGAVSNRKPVYHLVVNGKDISQIVRPLLMRLSLRECRGGEADQLDITLDDSREIWRFHQRVQPCRCSLGMNMLGWLTKALSPWMRWNIPVLPTR